MATQLVQVKVTPEQAEYLARLMTPFKTKADILRAALDDYIAKHPLPPTGEEVGK